MSIQCQILSEEDKHKVHAESIRILEEVGATFLSQASTIQACRSSEFIRPQLCDRNSFEQWVELGRPDVYDNAREKVEEILASPPKNPLPDGGVGLPLSSMQSILTY